MGLHAEGQSSSWPLQVGVLYLVGLSPRCYLLRPSFPGSHILPHEAMGTPWTQCRCGFPAWWTEPRVPVSTCVPVEAACWRLSAQCRMLWREEVDSSQLHLLNRLLTSILA